MEFKVMFNFIISNSVVGLSDLRAALKKRHIFLTLGVQDVLTRYRRSRVGAFWITVNMLILISVLGAVFGTIFRSNVSEFLPSLTIGIIVWGLISGLITEGCDSFTSVKDTILEVNLPYSVHVFRIMVRNLIIFGHNIAILPLVFIFFQKGINIQSLISVIGVFLIFVNCGWLILIVSIICTRYRDVTPIVQNVMQVAFYATPIIWDGKMLPSRIAENVLIYNPFYHLLNIVREPLIGGSASGTNWIVSLLMAAIGWIIAIYLLGKYKRKIAYWL